MQIRKIAMAAAAMVVSGSAQAATLVVIGDQPACAGICSGGDTKIQKFDPSLGTLTNVSLHIKGIYDQSYELTSWYDDGEDIPITTISYSITTPDGFIIGDSRALGTFISVTPVIGSGEFDMQSNYIFISLPVVNFEYVIDLDHSIFDELTGDGLVYGFISIQSMTASVTIEHSTGNASISLADGYAQEDIELTYTYTPAAVPEPATWAMMIAGFGLMGAAIRRRRIALTV